MSRRAYLYFALTFLLGALVGATCTYYYAWSHGHWRRPYNRTTFINHLTRDLDLSATQVQQLNQILDGSTGKFRAAQEQADSQLNAIRQETRSQIRQILSPQQSAKFDALQQRWDERRRRQGR